MKNGAGRPLMYWISLGSCSAVGLSSDSAETPPSATVAIRPRGDDGRHEHDSDTGPETARADTEPGPGTGPAWVHTCCGSPSPPAARTIRVVVPSTCQTIARL